MPASLDERALVERTLVGDREAFRLIVLRHQQQLAHLVTRQTGDSSLAEDLVQEAFLRAYQRLGSFDPRFALSTWLCRIALNVARDHHRRRVVRDRPRPPAASPAVPANPADVAAAREDLDRATQALGDLPSPQREVIVLSVYGGHTQREISDLLDVPLGTVKTRMRAALARLRALVTSSPPGGPS